MPLDLHSSVPDRRKLARLFGLALRELETVTTGLAHPLGFIILRQIPDDTGGYSRFHIWRRGNAGTQIPHTHSGHMNSTILLGRLRNSLWVADHGHLRPTPIVAVKKSDIDAPKYSVVGSHGLQLNSADEFGVGEAYELPAHIFHSNECLSEICVTFVERQACSGKSSLLARELKDVATSSRQNELLSRPDRHAWGLGILRAAQSIGIEPDMA